MSIQGIEQPEYIYIDESLRLRKYDDNCIFALAWYRDEETQLLVDGRAAPYDMDRLYRMYHYLSERGEVYFIEERLSGSELFAPIGDESFWQEDMPIVIGRKEHRGKGIGTRVIAALIQRAKELGFSYLGVAEIYDYNTGSKRAFEKMGFVPYKETAKGHSYRLELL